MTSFKFSGYMLNHTTTAYFHILADSWLGFYVIILPVNTNTLEDEFPTAQLNTS